MGRVAGSEGASPTVNRPLLQTRVNSVHQRVIQDLEVAGVSSTYRSHIRQFLADLELQGLSWPDVSTRPALQTLVFDAITRRGMNHDIVTALNAAFGPLFAANNFRLQPVPRPVKHPVGAEHLTLTTSARFQAASRQYKALANTFLWLLEQHRTTWATQLATPGGLQRHLDDAVDSGLLDRETYRACNVAFGTSLLPVSGRIRVTPGDPYHQRLMMHATTLADDGALTTARKSAINRFLCLLERFQLNYRDLAVTPGAVGAAVTAATRAGVPRTLRTSLQKAFGHWA
jgi:hypothetical protein